jgi:hypothetical protein
MKRYMLINLLIISMLVVISCDKHDDNNQVLVKTIDYTIVGDTISDISVWHQLNIRLKGAKIGNNDTYTYLDSVSLDLNSDSVKDFTFRYCLYSTRASGCTCLPKGRINIWINNDSNGSIISDSIKNAVIGLSNTDSVSIYNNTWHSNDSISVCSEGDISVRPNSLFDWDTKKFICFKVIDKHGFKQIGWIRIVRSADYCMIKDYSISKK